MVDTVRTKAQLLAAYASTGAGTITGQNGRDFIVTIIPYIDGTIPAWSKSTSLTEDVGGAGRARMARTGFVFQGASYNTPARAGTLLQLGDYPETLEVSSGPMNGVAIGIDNSTVFLTMQDMPSQVGGGDSHVQFHQVVRNSAAIPYMFGRNVWVALMPTGAEAFGDEIDINNFSQVAGLGRGLFISGDRDSYVPGSGNTGTANTPGGTYAAGTALEITAGANVVGNQLGNWTTGIKVNAIVAGGVGLNFSDSVSNHAGMAAVINMSGVTGTISVAAIYLGNNHGIRWANADASGGAIIRQGTNDTLAITAGASDQIYFFEKNGTSQAFAINTGDPSSGNTSLLITYHNGGSVQRVIQTSLTPTLTGRINVGLSRTAADDNIVAPAGSGFGADLHNEFADGADKTITLANIDVPANAAASGTWNLKLRVSSSAAGNNVALVATVRDYKLNDTAPTVLDVAVTGYAIPITTAHKIGIITIALPSTPAAGTLTTQVTFKRTNGADTNTGTVSLWDVWYEYDKDSADVGYRSLRLPK